MLVRVGVAEWLIGLNNNFKGTSYIKSYIYQNSPQNVPKFDLLFLTVVIIFNTIFKKCCCQNLLMVAKSGYTGTSDQKVSYFF